MAEVASPLRSSVKPVNHVVTGNHPVTTVSNGSTSTGVVSAKTSTDPTAAAASVTNVVRIRVYIADVDYRVCGTSCFVVCGLMISWRLGALSVKSQSLAD